MCLSRLSLKTPCLFGCDISWEQVPAINLLNEEISHWTISCWEPLTQASKAQLHCAASVLLLLSLPSDCSGWASTQQASSRNPQCHLESVGKCRTTRRPKGKSLIFLGCSLPSLPGFPWIAHTRGH